MDNTQATPQPKPKPIFLSLTDADGVLLDRFPVYLGGDNLTDEEIDVCERADHEWPGGPHAQFLVARIARVLRAMRGDN